MRYIKYVLVMMPVTALMPNGATENKIIPYGLSQWHDEQVWPQPCWRDDEVMGGIYYRLFPKFREAGRQKAIEQAGAVDLDLYVPVDDRDFEKWFPVVTKKGEKLPMGINEQVMQMLQPIIFAPSEAPKGARIFGDAVA